MNKIVIVFLIMGFICNLFAIIIITANITKIYYPKIKRDYITKKVIIKGVNTEDINIADELIKME